MTVPSILRFTAMLAVAVLIASSTSAAQQAPTKKSPTQSSVDAHVGRGYEALRQENYVQAVSEFQAALELDPKLVLKARFPLAVAYFEMHQPDDARREFEAVRKETGDHPNVLYYLGRLDLDARDLPAAIQNLNKAVAKPPFPDTSYYLAFAYLQQGNLVSAEKWFKQAAQVLPQDSRVPYQLGVVYRRLGREEESRKAFTLSSELRKHENNEAAIKGECAQKLDKGPREEAHAVCDQLYDDNSAEKLTALGTIYGQHGDLQAALKPLRRAAELAPQAPQMQYNLALVYFQLNQFEDARAPLVTALKRWPDLFQLNSLYGLVLLKLNEEVAAYDALHHAHELNPNDAGTVEILYPVAVELAQKSAEAKKYPDARRYLEEATKLRPQNPEPHKKLAELYSLTGDSSEAAAEEREAQRLSAPRN